MTHPRDADRPVDDSVARTATRDVGFAEQVVELREEQLVVHKELQERGEIIVRTTLEEVPGRIEVDAVSEEIEIQHEPAGETVSERREPWDEDGTLVVPVYEEQLVLVKRLVLKERVRIRRVGVRERRVFEDTLRRERLIVEDPRGTGMVREVYPTDGDGAENPRPDHERPSFLESIAHKVLE
jgi:uncharacterized protein (TIGR02271 family)